MKRYIIAAELPLTEEQEESLGSNYLVMPGTVPVGDLQILDVVGGSSLNPHHTLTVLGAWEWNGVSDDVTTLQLMDWNTFREFLPVRLPHNWAGWPDVFISA